MTQAAQVHHPTTKDYIRIAVVLGVLTAFEIALFYVEGAVGEDMPGWVFPLALISLSAIKFVMVVAYFMHLRYEKPMLSRVFSIGAVLALSLFLIVLAISGRIAISG